ncbi:Disease resistance protein (CC-NBS-LRR class) family protein [Rhynchospora pubera]|uniref:Disease resistance protein (CC-NBS-LRR class) family protein n=1 Tax=Rhynchospora pubera TaxID=906938 RepID=A0AAV8GB40_9POAL|nr:Disease resistance protein (CC-NBS-LRR class) family protein [Rhynchospora pubera]
MEVRSDPTCSKSPHVGFEALKNEIIDALLDTSNLKLSIIHIVGPPGVGKTYLAKEIYTSADVQNHFDELYWNGHYGGTHPAAVYSPNTDRYGKRYFTVHDNPDDHYDNSCCCRIRDSRDNNNGSRIVVTSRRKNVDCGGLICRLYEVGPRSDEESLEILGQITFPILKDQREGRSELFVMAKQLVAKCWGLPWPLRFLGGVLSEQPPPYTTSWKEVLHRIEANEAGGMVFVKFAMRYRDLPYHEIRAAFLYFPTFPDDAEIQAKSLVDLLKVEGLASDRENGMAILEDLANRSMIEVTKLCFHGSIKCCRLHDPLLRWLAIHEAKEQRFVSINPQSLYSDDPNVPIIIDLYNANIRITLDQVKSDYNPRATKIDIAHLADASCIFDFGKNFPLNTVLMSVRVLEIDNIQSTPNKEAYERAKNNMRNIRHIGVKNLGLSPERLDKLLAVKTWRIRHLSLRNMKVREIPKLPEHLEILDVGGTLIETIPEETHRKLSTLLLKGTKIRKIPNSFPELEYLDVRDTFVRTLPNYLWWRLKSVRASDTFEHLVGPPAGEDCKKKITLKTVHVRKSWEYKLPKFSWQLKKLGLSNFKNAANLHSALNWDVIIRLLCTVEELRSLKIQGSNVPPRIIDVATYPHGMSFLKDLWVGGSHSKFSVTGIKLPSSLITITLENLEFNKDPMSILEKLQHLKNLRLRWLWYTAQTKKMTCSTGKFSQLERLQLYHIAGLEEWSVQQGALPQITHVVIQSCKALKDLPDSLVHRMNPLTELHLISMPPRFTSRFSKLPFVKISENQI